MKVNASLQTGMRYVRIMISGTFVAALIFAGGIPAYGSARQPEPQKATVAIHNNGRRNIVYFYPDGTGEFSFDSRGLVGYGQSVVVEQQGPSGFLVLSSLDADALVALQKTNPFQPVRDGSLRILSFGIGKGGKDLEVPVTMPAGSTMFIGVTARKAGDPVTVVPYSGKLFGKSQASNIREADLKKALDFGTLMFQRWLQQQAAAAASYRGIQTRPTDKYFAGTIAARTTSKARTVTAVSPRAAGTETSLEHIVPGAKGTEPQKSAQAARNAPTTPAMVPEQAPIMDVIRGLSGPAPSLPIVAPVRGTQPVAPEKSVKGSEEALEPQASFTEFVELAKDLKTLNIAALAQQLTGENRTLYDVFTDALNALKTALSRKDQKTQKAFLQTTLKNYALGKEQLPTNNVEAEAIIAPMGDLYSLLCDLYAAKKGISASMDYEKITKGSPAFIVMKDALWQYKVLLQEISGSTNIEPTEKFIDALKEGLVTFEPSTASAEEQQKLESVLTKTPKPSLLERTASQQKRAKQELAEQELVKQVPATPPPSPATSMLGAEAGSSIALPVATVEATPAAAVPVVPAVVTAAVPASAEKAAGRDLWFMQKGMTDIEALKQGVTGAVRTIELMHSAKKAEFDRQLALIKKIVPDWRQVAFAGNVKQDGDRGVLEAFVRKHIEQVVMPLNILRTLSPSLFGLLQLLYKNRLVLESQEAYTEEINAAFLRAFALCSFSADDSANFFALVHLDAVLDKHNVFNAGGIEKITEEGWREIADVFNKKILLPFNPS